MLKNENIQLERRKCTNTHPCRDTPTHTGSNTNTHTHTELTDRHQTDAELKDDRQVPLEKMTGK